MNPNDDHRAVGRPGPDMIVTAELPDSVEVGSVPALLAAIQPDSPQLLIPVQNEAEPEVSIVIPALNEEMTITEFVGW